LIIQDTNNLVLFAQAVLFIMTKLFRF